MDRPRATAGDFSGGFRRRVMLTTALAAGGQAQAQPVFWDATQQLHVASGPTFTVYSFAKAAGVPGQYGDVAYFADRHAWEALEPRAGTALPWAIPVVFPGAPTLHNGGSASNYQGAGLGPFPAWVNGTYWFTCAVQCTIEGTQFARNVVPALTVTLTAWRYSGAATSWSKITATYRRLPTLAPAESAGGVPEGLGDVAVNGQNSQTANQSEVLALAGSVYLAGNPDQTAPVDYLGFWITAAAPDGTDHSTALSVTSQSGFIWKPYRDPVDHSASYGYYLWLPGTPGQHT